MQRFVHRNWLPIRVRRIFERLPQYTGGLFGQIGQIPGPGVITASSSSSSSHHFIFRQFFQHTLAEAVLPFDPRFTVFRAVYGGPLLCMVDRINRKTQMLLKTFTKKLERKLFRTKEM